MRCQAGSLVWSQLRSERQADPIAPDPGDVACIDRRIILERIMPQAGAPPTLLCPSISEGAIAGRALRQSCRLPGSQDSLIGSGTKVQRPPLKNEDAPIGKTPCSMNSIDGRV